MSKPFVPTPRLSRSGSPPLLRSSSSSSIYGNGADRRNDDGAEKHLMANLGGARPPSPTREKAGQDAHPPTGREQALPILNYCAASITMTVVNKVSSGGSE